MEPSPGKRDRPRRRRWRRWVLLAAAVVVLPPLGYYGWQRGVRTNFGVVVEGKVYRSAQPDADEIAAWSRRYGLKTIINLRGRQDDALDARNRSAAQQAGVRIVDVRMKASSMPSRQLLAELIEAIEQAETPVLLHCRDGADRTGVAAVMAAMAVGGQDYRQARGQLSLRYFHIPRGDDRIDQVMSRYEDYCRRKGLDTDGWPQFRSWALNKYAGP